MAAGVSYEDFWHGDPEIVRYAIECEQIRQRNEAIERDVLAWNTGRYVQLAVGTVISQAFGGNAGRNAKYPSEPMLAAELDEKLAKQKQERELAAQRDGFLALATAMAVRDGLTNG